MEAPDLFSTDWKLLSKQATINIHRRNEKNNRLYGVLGSLGVEEIDFLQKQNILQVYGEWFYIWANEEAPKKWEVLKKATVERFFYKEFPLPNNRSIIVSLMNKTRTEVRVDYSTSWNKLREIEIGEEEEEIYQAYVAFGKMPINEGIIKA